MSPTERLLHAILFEIFAVLLSVIAVKLTTDHPTGEATLLMLMISSIAMLWNMVFNWVWDKIFTGAREQRSVALRVAHTILFEGGLLLFTLPLVAYVLEISLLNAFILDLGLTLLIMVYTFFFNLIYDNVRAVILRKKVDNP